MKKDAAKIMLTAAGVPVPQGMVVSRLEAAKAHLLERPYVIKPIAEGSSVGVFVVTEKHEHPPQELFREDWSFGEMVLCERYIPGKELTCAVVRDQATDVIEIVPKVRFYDYEAKYAPGGSEHVLPAQVPADVYQAVRKLTVEAHHAWLPRRDARRFPLRRHARNRGAGLPRSQHHSGHDRDFAGAGTCGICRPHVRGPGALDGRGRLTQPIKEHGAWIFHTLAARPDASFRVRR